jgi:hypothetical protein
LTASTLGFRLTLPLLRHSCACLHWVTLLASSMQILPLLEEGQDRWFCQPTYLGHISSEQPLSLSIPGSVTCYLASSCCPLFMNSISCLLNNSPVTLEKSGGWELHHSLCILHNYLT